MAEIVVGELVALVDDADAEAVLAAGPWHPRRRNRNTHAMAHARRPDGRRTTVQMHILILGAPGVDHVNGNGLDNRRENLRLCNQSQNTANSRRRVDNSTGYKGVTKKPNRPTWIAQIRVNGKQQHIGSFATPEDAARAYDERAIAAWGEFAQTNYQGEQL